MYMRLLMNCWTEGSIPADPIRLQRLLKISSKTFRSCWPSVAPCFAPDGDGRLSQLRLERERVLQRERSMLNSEKGRKGGRPMKSTPDRKPGLSPGFPPGFHSGKPGESLSSSSSERQGVPPRERSMLNSENGRKGGRPMKSTPDRKPGLSPGFHSGKPSESLSSSSSSSSSFTETDTEQTRAGARLVRSLVSVSPEECAAVDAFRENWAIEVRRVERVFRAVEALGQDLQAFVDSVRSKDRPSFSVHRWQMCGDLGVPQKDSGLIVLRMLADSLEARQRALSAPQLNAKTQSGFDAIDIVLEKRAQHEKRRIGHRIQTSPRQLSDGDRF